jgi:hypothetical protein
MKQAQSGTGAVGPAKAVAWDPIGGERAGGRFRRPGVSQGTRQRLLFAVTYFSPHPPLFPAYLASPFPFFHRFNPPFENKGQMQPAHF